LHRGVRLRPPGSTDMWQFSTERVRGEGLAVAGVIGRIAPGDRSDRVGAIRSIAAFEFLSTDTLSMTRTLRERLSRVLDLKGPSIRGHAIFVGHALVGIRTDRRCTLPFRVAQPSSATAVT
jgi:hypothetical protein